MLLTLEQAAKEANVSQRTLRRLIKGGRLKAQDFGAGGKGKNKVWRISPEALLDLLPSQLVLENVTRLSAAPRRGRRSRSSSSARQYLPDALA